MPRLSHNEWQKHLEPEVEDEAPLHGSTEGSKAMAEIDSEPEDERFWNRNLYLETHQDEEADVIDTTQKGDRFVVTPETVEKIRRKFEASIQYGLAHLEHLRDDQVLHMGMDGERGDITVAEFRHHVLDMRNPKNPFGHGHPFKVWLLENPDSPEDLRERDLEEMRRMQFELAQTFKQYPPDATLYYADTEESYDPISYQEIKSIKVGDAIEALENDKADFWKGSPFQFISADKDFDPDAHLVEIRVLQKQKQYFLDVLKELADDRKVVIHYPGKTPITAPVSEIRWKIHTADKDELLQLGLGLNFPALVAQASESAEPTPTETPQ